MPVTTRRPVVAGNWKMHMTIPEARELVLGLVGPAAGLEPAELIVIPPFTALAEISRLLEGTGIGVGAQNLFWEDRGAYTGEVSGPMLKDAGCTHVLVGHSERRQYFGETDQGVNRKVRAALRSGLTPIVCIGETLEEREACATGVRVGHQLEEALKDLGPEEASSLILAYEPVWAIGTGRTASPAQAEEVHARIRSFLEEKYGKERAAYAIILYGGSVKPANAYALFLEKDIDGFLVGGASLEAESFIGIAREALRADREVK